MPPEEAYTVAVLESVQAEQTERAQEVWAVVLSFQQVQAVFAGCVGEMPYSDLKQRLMTQAHVSESTAKRRIKQWFSIGLIRLGSTACYLRT